MPTPNQQIAATWFDEVWNKGRRSAIAEMLTPDVILHDGGPPHRGVEAFHEYFDRMQATFSEIRTTVDDVFGEGDKVCVRWSVSMLHTGPGLGIEPTGKPVNATGLTVMRIEDGKLAEGWQNWDMLGVLNQIGAREGGAHGLSVTA